MLQYTPYFFRFYWIFRFFGLILFFYFDFSVFRFGSVLIFKEIRFFEFGSVWEKIQTETRMHIPTRNSGRGARRELRDDMLCVLTRQLPIGRGISEQSKTNWNSTKMITKPFGDRFNFDHLANTILLSRRLHCLLWRAIWAMAWRVWAGPQFDPLAKFTALGVFGEGDGSSAQKSYSLT